MDCSAVHIYIVPIIYLFMFFIFYFLLLHFQLFDFNEWQRHIYSLFESELHSIGCGAMCAVHAFRQDIPFDCLDQKN